LGAAPAATSPPPSLWRPRVLFKPLAGWDLAVSRLLQARREAGRLFGLCEHASEIAPRAAATGYENIRDHCAYIRHLPNKRFAQINSNGSVASTSDKGRVVVTIKRGKYAMFVSRIKSPRCPQCGAMMSLRIIEPERPGFDSRTFECPKCYDTETFVASISHEINVSIGPA
jgi:hypothetical protein